jgi:hypothetical protein
MSRRVRNCLIWTAVFGVTMGLFEAAVVVYLRRIAYPEGFSFPLVTLERRIALVEIAREFASLVMILSVAVLAGKRHVERFACFMYIFGIWDILYYVFLKITLGWPGSILDPDILFLIPVPWVGPVLAPVLVSLVMISAGVVAIRLEEIGSPIRVTWRNLGAEIVCGLVIVISFCLDSGNILEGGVPGPFAWWLFLLGLVPGIGIFAYEASMSLRRKRVEDAARSGQLRCPVDAARKIGTTEGPDDAASK